MLLSPRRARSAKIPRYYPKTGELWVGDVKVRRYERRGKQHLILKEFQRLRWPPCIDAPPGCEPLTVENRSRDVIHLLNQNHSRALIHFSSDGTGLGVCWKLLEERVINEPGGQPPTMGVRRPNRASLGHKRVREWLSPLPPRYRNEVNSSYFPASGFPAPGGPVEIAPGYGGPTRSAFA